MFRLAAFGLSKPEVADISVRIRGFSVSLVSDSENPPNLCDEFDGVVYSDASSLSIESVAPWLQAGKSVLITSDARSLRGRLTELGELSRRTGARFAIVNPDHFVPSRQLVRQQVASGKLGEPGLVRIHRWESRRSDVAYVPNELSWSLIRDLELAQWLFGQSPAVVFAVEQVEEGQTSLPCSLVQIHLGFKGGGMALITHSQRLPEGDGYQSLSVIGSSGAAYADDHHNRQLVYGGGAPVAVQGGEGNCLVLLLLQSFVDGFTETFDSTATSSNWNDVWDVADAVVKSLETRKAIHREVAHHG